LPFVAKESADEALWTPLAWLDWVVGSGLTGMALSFAKHSLLQGLKAGVAVLEIAPRHEVLAQQSFQTLKTRLLQAYPQIELQLTLVEPIAQTPLQIEEQRTLAQKKQAETEFLADPIVQNLLNTFNAQLISQSLIVGEKR
jgi:DNA polymerase-3 subunit gamma/tau